MKHNDETLQAAIDAAMLEIGKQVSGKNFAACPKYYRSAWPEEADDRLDLAKAFLAKLPAGLQASEADKALADLASRLANIAYDPVQPMAFAKSVADHVDDLREDINHAQKVSLADARATDATIARLNAELAAMRQPILADDGRSLGQLVHDILAKGFSWDRLLKSDQELCKSAAQAVSSVVLAQAIRRMEAVPVDKLKASYWQGQEVVDCYVAVDRVRARLIAAVKSEERPLMTKNIPGDKCPLCGAEEVESNTPNTVYACGSSDYDDRPGTFHQGDQCEARGEPDSTDWKAKYEQAEAERKKWEEDALRYCKNADYWKARAEKAEEEVAALKGDMLIAERAVDNVLKILPEMVKSPSWEDAAITIREHIDKLQKELTEVIARAEKAESDAAVNYGMLLAARDHTKKAEAELAALKSSQIGILRPLAEAWPVPDGCVRLVGNNKTDGKWTLATWEDEYDTHFADIRLPSNEIPSTANNQLKQPNQQVPLGPEQKLQAIKNILEIK